MHKINLDQSPKSFTHGGVQVFLNWSDVSGEMEPAFVFRKALGDTRAVYVMPMSFIHQIVQSSGFPALRIMAEAAKVAEAIGFARMDRQATMAVADLIVERTEDLFDMFPEPPSVAQAQAGRKGEMAIQIDGETVMEMEVAA